MTTAIRIEGSTCTKKGPSCIGQSPHFFALSSTLTLSQHSGQKPADKKHQRKKAQTRYTDGTIAQERSR